MNNKLKKQINEFLDSSNLITNSTHPNPLTFNLRPRKYQLKDQQSYELPTGLKNNKRQKFNSTSLSQSRNKSLRSEANNLLSVTLTQSLLKSDQKTKFKKHRMSKSVTINKLNIIREVDSLEQFIKVMYTSKMKDLNIQNYESTEKPFIIRMQLGLSVKKFNCTDLGIGKNSLELIQKFLYKFEDSIHTLILNNNPFNLECFVIISKILNTSKIIKLSLISTGLNSQSCKMLLGSILQNVYLVDLNLSSHDGLYRNKLGSEGLKPLKKLFDKVPNLHMIDLTGSSISQSGFASICEGLQNNSSLCCLEIARNLITQSLFFDCFSKLSNCQLNIIDLSGNNIRDKGMILLGEILGKNYAYNSLSMSLTHLNVTQNNISVLGVDEFVKSMDFNSTLEELILDQNKLVRSKSTFVNFKSYIHYGVAISHLRMKRTGIELSDIVLLCEGIQKSNSLLVLDLSENILEEFSIKNLGIMFKYNQSLKTVYLKQCSIIDNHFNYLSEGISYNQCIEKIHLDKNFLKDQSAVLIQQFLILRRNITLVSLQKNLISLQQLRRITSILSDNIYISSGQPSFTGFARKKQINLSKIQKLNQQIEELTKRVQKLERSKIEKEVLCILLQIDQVKHQIQKEKAAIIELSKPKLFMTQK